MGRKRKRRRRKRGGELEVGKAVGPSFWAGATTTTSPHYQRKSMHGPKGLRAGTSGCTELGVYSGTLDSYSVQRL